MGVAEHLLSLEGRRLLGIPAAGLEDVGGRQVAQLEEVAVKPLCVGAGGGQVGLDLGIPDDPTPRRVDEEHPARLEAALLDHLVGGHVHDTDLAGHHDQVVVGHPVAAGSKAVPIEDRTYDRSVGECDRRRPVPWLHERSVVLVEGPAFV